MIIFSEYSRSSLQDCREAVKLNPNYTKAKLRIPHCLFHLGNYGECIQHCEEILKDDKNNMKIVQLQNDADEKKVGSRANTFLYLLFTSSTMCGGILFRSIQSLWVDNGGR